MLGRDQIGANEAEDAEDEADVPQATGFRPFRPAILLVYDANRTPRISGTTNGATDAIEDLRDDECAVISPIGRRQAGLVPPTSDPRGLLPLTGINPVGASAAAALRYERPSARPQVRGALLAVTDGERGGEAKYDCGVRVWRRTVVVYILDRASLPAQSASQRVYFVRRFANGY